MVLTGLVITIGNISDGPRVYSLSDEATVTVLIPMLFASWLGSIRLTRVHNKAFLVLGPTLRIEDAKIACVVFVFPIYVVSLLLHWAVSWLAV